jgi:hypothetical protein
MKGRLRKLKKAGLAGRMVGTCKGCGCSVRTDDRWRSVPGGVAHRECAEYIATSRRAA